MATATLDLKEQAREAGKVVAQLKATAGEKWKAVEAVKAKIADSGVNMGDGSDEAKAAFDELDQVGRDYDSVRDQVTEQEQVYQRLLEMAGETAAASPKAADQLNELIKTVGDRVARSEWYAELKASGRLESREVALGTTGQMRALDRRELKNLVTGASGTSAGAFVVEDRQPGYVDLLRRPLGLIDLVTVSDTDSDTVEWVRQTSRTNAAAETAEATAVAGTSGAAPESAFAFEVVETNVRDITTWIAATKRALADAGQLRGIIDTELADNVRERLDGQLASGDGQGENLRGIYNTQNILSYALGTGGVGETRSDAIHRAITKIRLAHLEPFAIGIHPEDYEDVVLEKDKNDNYIYGPPSAPQRGTVWGLAPVVNQVFPKGTPLVGNYTRGATLWLREGLSIAVSDSHDNFFIRRMVAVLAVMRAAFGVARPDAFCEVDLGGGS